MFFWQSGVLQYLQQHTDLACVPMVGSSGGGFIAAFARCGVCPHAALKLAAALLDKHGIHKRRLGLLGVWGLLVSEWLEELLPQDASERCNAVHTGIVVTEWPSLRVHTISKFHGRADLIEVLLASAHVPWFLDLRATTTCRGMRVIDGSLRYLMVRSGQCLVPGAPVNVQHTTSAPKEEADAGTLVGVDSQRPSYSYSRSCSASSSQLPDVPSSSSFSTSSKLDTPGEVTPGEAPGTPLSREAVADTPLSREALTGMPLSREALTGRLRHCRDSARSMHTLPAVTRSRKELLECGALDDAPIIVTAASVRQPGNDEVATAAAGSTHRHLPAGAAVAGVGGVLVMDPRQDAKLRAGWAASVLRLLSVEGAQQLMRSGAEFAADLHQRGLLEGLARGEGGAGGM